MVNFCKLLGGHFAGRGCPTCVKISIANSLRYTLSDFLSKARSVHGDKYDYSKVIYAGRKKPVIIICPDHGEFLQTPHHHFGGAGCPKCSAACASEKKRFTIDKFLSKSRSVHGDKYDYSKVVYVRNIEKVIIICSTHGEFLQTPAGHFAGRGCRICAKISIANSLRHTLSDFISKARSVHGDKYDYSKVIYAGSKKPVIIICSKHGEFLQNPSSHTEGGNCPKCVLDATKKRFTLSAEDFTLKARSVHGDRYDYSKVVYSGNEEKVIISCRDHGEFLQTPHHHFDGAGCPKCAGTLRGITKRLSMEKFLDKAHAIHGDRYNYLKVVYVNSNTKVRILCRKHGYFMQTPGDHFNGAGCSLCAGNYANGENLVIEFLKKYAIPYEREVSFPDCKYKQVLLFDLKITIDKKILLVEIDGPQHFRPVSLFGGQEAFEENKKRDSIKNSWAKKNNIPLVRLRHTGKLQQEIRVKLIPEIVRMLDSTS